MSSEKEMTPEEKLLALIQQDKRSEPAVDAGRPAVAPVAAPGPAAIPVQPVPVATSSAAAGAPADAASGRVPAHDAPAAVKAATPESPKPVPSSPAAAPVRPGSAVEGRGAVSPSPAAPVPAAAVPEAGAKLKLAATPLPLSPKGAETRPTPAPAEEAKGRAPVAHVGRGGSGSAPASSRETPLAGPVTLPPSAVPAAAPPERPAPAAPAPKAPRASVHSLMSWPILNRILALVVLVLLVVVVYSVASIQSDVDKAVLRQVNQAGALPVQPAGIEAVTPLPVDEYLRKVSGRDIFRMAEAAGPASNAAPAAAEFRLVGVSLDGHDPKGSMAILRSKTSSQTFFVKVGDALGNTGFTLDRVLVDRAILKKQKQELEVR